MLELSKELGRARARNGKRSPASNNDCTNQTLGRLYQFIGTVKYANIFAGVRRYCLMFVVGKTKLSRIDWSCRSYFTKSSAWFDLLKVKDRKDAWHWRPFLHIKNLTILTVLCRVSCSWLGLNGWGKCSNFRGVTRDLSTTDPSIGKFDEVLDGVVGCQSVPFSVRLLIFIFLSVALSSSSTRKLRDLLWCIFRLNWCWKVISLRTWFEIVTQLLFWNYVIHTKLTTFFWMFPQTGKLLLKQFFSRKISTLASSPLQ